LPDKLSDTQGRSILLACAELIGGVAELARHLNVPTETVAEWLAGRSSPPPEVLVTAVEEILQGHRKKRKV
jgi:hypothetical protein